MALHEINIALGPEATVNMLLEKYPERHFLKYKSLDDHRKFMPALTFPAKKQFFNRD